MTPSFFVTLVGWCIWLSTAAAAIDPPPGSVLLEGEAGRPALLLLHGRGRHPRWKVVEPLRRAVHRELGWTTLSLQMPAEDKPWRAYAKDFPRAWAVIESALKFVRRKEGAKRVYLLGHSMGARMAAAYLAAHPEAPVDGLVVIGCRNNGGAPLDCRQSLETVERPVLDLWGGADTKDKRAGRQRRHLRSDRYTQMEIAGASHRFEGHEQALTTAVVEWLKKRTQHP